MIPYAFRRASALPILIVLAASVSCIPLSKLTYLERDESDSDSLAVTTQRVDYRLQQNDIVNIKVTTLNPETQSLFNKEENYGNLNAGDVIFYLQGYSVDLDGNIDLPVVGSLNVLGKTVSELKSEIQLRMNDYFSKDAVNVSVQLAGLRFTAIGEVSRPGKYVIYQNQATIIDALAMAGDITMVGNRTEVQIVRQTNGGVQFFSIDLTDHKAVQSPEFFIQPNDVINVYPLRAKSWGIGTTGFATFASVITVLASTATLIYTLSRID